MDGRVWGRFVLRDDGDDPASPVASRYVCWVPNSYALNEATRRRASATSSNPSRSERLIPGTRGTTGISCAAAGR